MTGVCKFFTEEKGFGFLSNDADGKEVFVHVSGCLEEIHKGDKVEFDVVEGKRGPQAANVKLL